MNGLQSAKVESEEPTGIYLVTSSSYCTTCVVTNTCYTSSLLELYVTFQIVIPMTNKKIS